MNIHYVHLNRIIDTMTNNIAEKAHVCNQSQFVPFSNIYSFSGSSEKKKPEDIIMFSNVQNQSRITTRVKRIKGNSQNYT